MKGISFMPSIKERKGKKGSGFLAEVRLKGFPPLAKTFKRKSEAKYWAMEVESDLRSGRNLEFYEKNPKTLSDAISRYIENPLPGQEQTVADYAWMLKFWDTYIGHLKLLDLTPSIIFETRQKLILEPTSTKRISRRKKPVKLKNSTINRHTAALSAVLNRALRDWGWISNNPARGVRRLKESNQRKRFLSFEEKQILLDECKKSINPELFDFVSFALLTGAP